MLWSGPKFVSCFIGVNCDNHHMYKYNSSCLYCPKLLSMHKRLGDEFIFPRATAENQCSYSINQRICLPLRSMVLALANVLGLIIVYPMKIDCRLLSHSSPLLC